MMELELVVVETERRNQVEVKIVKGGETVKGEIARYPIQEGINFKIEGWCFYGGPDPVSVYVLQ